MAPPQTLTHHATPAKAQLLTDAHEGLSKASYHTYSKLFRDPEIFEAVEDEVLWELGKYAIQQSSETVEAWSVGCSAGEEVFSLLMSWEQAVAAHLPGVSLDFFGTDLSDDAVDAARRGEYGSHAVQDVPEAWLERCFEVGAQEDGQPCFTVNSRVAQHADFIQQDMREELPRHIAEGKKFDLIICRYSVFLYCEKMECVQFINDVVTKCLRPGGFLFIGAPDELPQGWRSLGLQEYHGHKGVYRLGDDPLFLQPGDPRFLQDSLTAFLRGKQRPASERIGRPEQEREEVTLSAEQIELQNLRFAQQIAKQKERAKQLREEAEKLEDAEVADTVYISRSRAEEVGRRMQEEAGKRAEKIRRAAAEERQAETKRARRRERDAAKRRKPKKDEIVAVSKRAQAAQAAWVARAQATAERKRAGGNGAKGGGGLFRRPTPKAKEAAVAARQPVRSDEEDGPSRPTEDDADEGSSSSTDEEAAGTASAEQEGEHEDEQEEGDSGSSTSSAGSEGEEQGDLSPRERRPNTLERCGSLQQKQRQQPQRPPQPQPQEEQKEQEAQEAMVPALVLPVTDAVSWTVFAAAAAAAVGVPDAAVARSLPGVQVVPGFTSLSTGMSLSARAAPWPAAAAAAVAVAKTRPHSASMEQPEPQPQQQRLQRRSIRRLPDRQASATRQRSVFSRSSSRPLGPASSSPAAVYKLSHPQEVARIGDRMVTRKSTGRHAWTGNRPAAHKREDALWAGGATGLGPGAGSWAGDCVRVPARDYTQQAARVAALRQLHVQQQHRVELLPPQRTHVVAPRGNVPFAQPAGGTPVSQGLVWRTRR